MRSGSVRPLIWGDSVSESDDGSEDTGEVEGNKIYGPDQKGTKQSLEYTDRNKREQTDLDGTYEFSDIGAEVSLSSYMRI